jgi:hypothetical protein
MNIVFNALTCKQHGRGFQNLQILLKIAKKIMTKRNMNIKNILTNQTTALDMYSVLIPKDFIDSSLIGRLKI